MEKILNVSFIFSRYFIPGIVFYVFVIWFPLLFLNTLGISYTFLDKVNSTISNPTFIVVASIAIGILLVMVKSYALIQRIIGMSKEGLENAIIEGFTENAIIKGFEIRIEISEIKEKTRKEIATKIHDGYIKARHPEIYKHIQDQLTHADIFSMALLSILCSNWPIIVILYHIGYKEGGWSLYLPILWLIIPMVVFLLGKTKLRQEYKIAADFTREAVRKAYDESENISISRFIDDIYKKSESNKNITREALENETKKKKVETSNFPKT